MLKLFSFFLNWLGGGALTTILGHLEKRQALANDSEKAKGEITIAAIKSELAVRQEQAAILKTQLGHPIAWFPRFTIEMTVAVYFMAHVVDSIWNLSGDVRPLGTAEAGVMATAIAGMFISSTFGRKG